MKLKGACEMWFAALLYLICGALVAGALVIRTEEDIPWYFITLAIVAWPLAFVFYFQGVVRGWRNRTR